MKYHNYELTTHQTLELYKDRKIKKIMNTINQKTSTNIELIEKILSKKVFKVPYYEIDTSWGTETIYLPFTNKLFKVISTKYNETSLQLHPIKNETWYPLKNVIINDGEKNIPINKNTIIIIKSNTTHNLLKNGLVFEVQDNIPFDYTETYRIYDKCKREIHESKFNAYHFLKNHTIDLKEDSLLVKAQVLEKDSFIYSKTNDIRIEYDGKSMRINKKELWFLSKNTKIVNDISNTILIEAEYIKEK